jgi:hypothetical protein
MAYTDKELKKTYSIPTPQYFNPTADDWEVLYGRNNASRVELYDSDGNPLLISDGKMAVRASELETLIGEVQDTPTTNTLMARLKSLEDKINAITSGDTPAFTQLLGSNVAEMQDQSNATADVLTFSENITSIEIYHSETTPQSFVVNGLTLIVAAGGWRSPIAGTPGATVGIPTGVNCIVARLV